MSRNGKNSGGNKKTGKEVADMRNAFVEKLVESPIPQDIAPQAAVDSGYSKNTKVAHILAAGSPVHTKAMIALEKRGITWDKVAEEYFELLELSKQDGAKEKDLKSLVQGLKQLGWLLQGGKPVPQVAVQINNNNGTQSRSDPESNDPGAIRKLLGEVEASIKRLEKAVGGGGPGELHAGDAGIIDAEACPDVAGTDREAQEDSDRGES